MPVIVLEASDLTSPVSLVRMWALLSGCLTFSLVASMDKLVLDSNNMMNSFKILCMFTWCFFFALTLLIHVVNVIQFHSLIPISWKNLTVTVASLAALMTLSASVSFPWLVMNLGNVQPGPVAATVASCLTCLAYTTEAFLIRTQTTDQRGYMASVPGLLKVLQIWGGCEVIVLVVEQGHHYYSGDRAKEGPCVLLLLSGTIYILCLLMALGNVVVVLGDCAGQCPVPFDRLLAGFSLTGVVLYMVATIMCISQLIDPWQRSQKLTWPLVVMETVMASITLLAYTMDLAFSIKLLCDRSQT